MLACIAIISNIIPTSIFMASNQLKIYIHDKISPKDDLANHLYLFRDYQNYSHSMVPGGLLVMS